MERSVVGLFVGLLLGLAWALAGFWDMALVAAMGAAGWLAVRIVHGDLDVVRFAGRNAPQRR